MIWIKARLAWFLDPSDAHTAMLVDADFLKLLFSGLGFGVFALGYTYTSAFHGAFGVSLSELGVGALEFTLRGLALLQDPKVAVIGFAVLATTSVIISLRKFLREAISIAMFLVGFGLYMSFTIWGGSYLGLTHARAVITGQTGSPVYCTFQDAEEGTEVAGLIRALRAKSERHGLRLIHLGENYVFLAQVVDFDVTARDSGEVLAVPVAFVGGCRIVSAYDFNIAG